MATLYRSKCFCTNLRRSANAVTEYYDRWFGDLELTAAQYYLLINLSRLDHVNAADWARYVGLERSTLVRNAQGLLRRGWIEESGPGRGKQFRLTQAGKALLEQAVPRWERAQAEMQSLLGQEDAAALLRITEKLQDWREAGDTFLKGGRQHEL